MTQASQRLRAAVPHIWIFACLLAMGWRAWLPFGADRHAFAWDAVWEYWGDLQFLADAVGAGDWPLWNPHDRLGYPFFADPQAGVLYPGNWIVVAVAWCLGHTPYWLVSLKIWMHFQLAGSGTYVLTKWLLRHASPTVTDSHDAAATDNDLAATHRAAALIAALLVVTSYPFLHNAFSALNWSAAWAPLWLWAQFRALRKPTWQRGLCWGAIVALCALAGGWAGVFYTVLIAAPLGIAWLVHERPRGFHQGRRIMITIAIALATALVLSGAQLWATLELLPMTARAARTPDFWGFTVLDTRDLIGFWVPQAPGENSYVLTCAVVWALMMMHRRAGAFSWGLWFVVAFSAVLAFGNKLPVLPWLAAHDSPFAWFRRAHRYLYVMVVPLAVLAALGFARAAMPSTRRALWYRIVFVAAALLGAFLAASMVAQPFSRMLVLYAVGILLLTTVPLWLPQRRWALPALVAMVSAAAMGVRSDKLAISFHATPRPPNDTWLQQATARAGWPQRIYDRGAVGYRPGIRLRQRDLGGYEGDPLALRRFQFVLADVTVRPARAAVASVAWTTPVVHPLRIKHPTPSPAWSVPSPKPDAYWTNSVQAAASAHEAWKGATLTTTTSEAFTLMPPITAAATMQSADVTEWQRNRLVVRVDAPSAGVVVIQEMFHPGWRATVNGAPADMLPANGFARAVKVPAGASTVVLTYDAPGFRRGAVVACLGWLALLAVAWRVSRVGHDAQKNRAPLP